MHVALRNVYRLSQLNSERASHFVLKRWKATAAPAVEYIEIINLKSLFLRVRLDAKNRQQRRKVHADTRDSIQKLKKSEIQLMVKVCTQKELNNFSTSLSKIFPSRSKWTSIPFRKTSCSGPKHCLVECLWQRMFVYLLKWIPGKQFVLNL